MVRFENIKFDCRLYNGYKPCVYGNDCGGCPFYDPLDKLNAGWFPTLEKAELQNLPASARVLIIKTGALGDVLRTTTLLHALKRTLPQSHVTWVTAYPALPLLSANPYIDELVGLDDLTAQAMSEREFDAVICLEKEGPQLTLAGRIKATRRVGYFATPWNTAAISNEEARYMLVLGVSDDLKFYHNRKSYPEIIAEAAGLPYQRDPYILELNPAGVESRGKMLDTVRLHGRAHLPTVGLNTGCGAVFRTKQWTLEGWTATAQALVEGNTANVLLMGGDAEAELNAAIEAAVPGVIHTGTDNSLDEFFGIVEACDVVVTSDSLGMHVAIARQKQVVALFGSTSHHEIDLYDLGEKIITDYPCSPCYLKTCEKKPMCMEAMTADTVLAAVHRRLKARISSPGING